MSPTRLEPVETAATAELPIDLVDDEVERVRRLFDCLRRGATPRRQRRAWIVTQPRISRFRRENHPVSRPIGSMSDAASTDRLLRPDEVADRLGVPPGTLANRRYQGHGPTYLKVGRHVRYRAVDVDAWLDRQAVTGHR